MYNSNPVTRIFFLLWVLIALAPAESSAQLLKASLEDLTKASTSIVHGETVQVRSFWTSDNRYIMTEATIQVEETVRGMASTSIVVTIPGGRVGNTEYEVSDMPVFSEGEEVVVFVSRHSSGSNMVVGGVQGKLGVASSQEGGTRMVSGVGNWFESDNLTRPDEESDNVQSVALDELKRRIKETGQ